MILELSDAAAPWWVELRRESTYLGVGYATATFAARRFDGTIAITIRLDLVPALLSAIEELLVHPALAAVDPVAGESWSAWREATRSSSPGQATSTWSVDEGDAEGGLARTIEVEHGHLAHLRQAVADLVSWTRGSPGFRQARNDVAEADGGEPPSLEDGRGEQDAKHTRDDQEGDSVSHRAHESR